ncbi:hypothetical protein WJX79_006253 [Trebouxia sp. C0005]
MEATLSFNACHVRRTLGVQHSVRRLTSYRHELQQGAKCRPRRSYATVCSSSLGHAYSITDSTGTIPQQQGQQPDAAGVDISLLAEKLQGAVYSGHSSTPILMRTLLPWYVAGYQGDHNPV